MNAFIRNKAKQDLSGNWLLAIGALLIVGVVSFLIQSGPQLLTGTYTVMPFTFENGEFVVITTETPAGITFLNLMSSLFLLNVIQVGYLSLHLKLANYQPTDLTELASGFRFGYLRVVLTTLLTTLIASVIFIPFLLSAYLLVFANSIESLFFWLLAMILIPVTFIWGISNALSLVMVPYELANSESMNNRPLEVISASRLIMKDNKLNLLMLAFSFIPWLLLVVITFGVAGLYVFPYMNQSFVNFYDENRMGL